MKRVLRGLLIGLVVILALFLVVPMLVSLPPLPGAVPAKALADPDSRFVSVNGLEVHYKEAGSGEPALLLLHGFGASVFSWREVMEPLSRLGRVIAFDRPAFGLTSRPMPGQWTGPNPYSTASQVDLNLALMDHWGLEKTVLVGNSAGGTLALLTALEHPERVQALVLVDAAVYTAGGSPGWLRPLLGTPQIRRIGPLLLRSAFPSQGENLIHLAWHNPARITPEVLAGYKEPLQVENWDRALWELVVATSQPDLASRLDQVRVPTLVVTGDDDRIVPTAESLRLAGELPMAELAVLPACGHVPQEECPGLFLDAVTEFLAQRVIQAD